MVFAAFRRSGPRLRAGTCGTCGPVGPGRHLGPVRPATPVGPPAPGGPVGPAVPVGPVEHVWPLGAVGAVGAVEPARLATPMGPAVRVARPPEVHGTECQLEFSEQNPPCSFQTGFILVLWSPEPCEFTSGPQWPLNGRSMATNGHL